jgi:ectoine hydroxylase-related dioxygenase (phytanoyl-CoA dioxygenase family)
MDVSPEQKDFYENHGFLLGYPILSPEEADELLQDYLAFMRGERYHPQWKRGGLNRFQKLPFLSRHIKTKTMEALVGRAQSIAAQLLGCEVFLWGDQSVMKPAGSDVIVAWHQDLAYWCNYERKQALRTDQRAVTCWVALDDVDESRGPVSFVSGSHRDTYPHQCVVEPTDDYNIDDRLFVEPSLVASRGQSIVQGCLKKGQCSFHDSGTLHGSGPNRSSSPRYGYSLHFWPGKRRETRKVPSRWSWWLRRLPRSRA